MQLSRFWASVWSVVVYLFGVGLLQYLLGMLVTLFGLVSGGPAMLLRLAVAAVVPIAGTLVFLDWRWSWKAEHIGMGRDSRSIGWLLAGLAGGGLAAYLTHVASAVLDKVPLGMPALQPFDPVRVLFTLVTLFGAEMVFRGAAISRYQADLTPREVLLAAPLTPLAWLLLESFFHLGGPPTGMSTLAEFPMIAALVFLYLRTDSVWLSAGLRMGVYAGLTVTSLSVSPSGQMLVWGIIALVLLALEWNKQQRMPRRVQPRTTNRGRTVRGPWGPH